MRKATLDKINDIKKMQQEGQTDIEIVKAKFGRNWKKYHEFMGKHELLEVAPQFKKYEPPYEVNVLEDVPIVQNVIPLNSNPVQVLAPAELGKLKQLIENTDDLLSLLQESSDDIEQMEILQVPEELIRIQDLRVRSIRVSKSIEKEFDAFVKEQKIFSKTTLINHALREYLQKYLQK